MTEEQYEQYRKGAKIHLEIAKMQNVLEILNTGGRLVLSLQDLNHWNDLTNVLVGENNHEIFQVIRQYAEEKIKSLQEEFEAL